MKESLSTDPYKGVRDFYPQDWARLQSLFAALRTTLALWGYEEYNASPLERAELYEAKTSEEIVTEQTYTFTDRGDRRVTLRPEMTPTLARMIAAKRRELSLPVRWFSIPNIFRYERPQRGRLREHYQLNVDLIGIASDEADIELIRLASNLLTTLGASTTDFIIRVNSRDLLTAACGTAGLSPDETRAYLRLLDKKDKMPHDDFESARREIATADPLASLDTKDIEAFVGRLKERGVTNVVFDPTLTRGFDYYTGYVFEIFDANTKNPRSLFGGGRFDKLVSLFGGDPIPAVGFGMGDVTLTDFLTTHGLPIPAVAGKPELYIGTPTPADVVAAQGFADLLRQQGVRAFVNLSERSLGDQVRDALKRNIPYFAAFGSAEGTSGSVRVKALATSEETALPLSEIATYLHSHT